MDKALQEAIRTAGGLHALGRKLGISHQAVSQWRRVPAERVLDVERLTGISRYQLRPDVFGKR
jgi:DNA-binding transcriptional regulator YdaS (Cro superfamily)